MLGQLVHKPGYHPADAGKAPDQHAGIDHD
jgi:hypothetical protein